MCSPHCCVDWWIVGKSHALCCLFVHAGTVKEEEVTGMLKIPEAAFGELDEVTVRLRICCSFLYTLSAFNDKSCSPLRSVRLSFVGSAGIL